jgi:hypothetical protein
LTMIILFNMKFWLKSKVGISIFHISWIWHQVQTPNAQQIVRHFNYMLHVLNFCLYLLKSTFRFITCHLS